LDAFSDVLRVIRLSGGVFLESEFSAPWCINGKISAEDCAAFHVVPRHVIASHFVASGRMQLQVGDGEAIEVRDGELVLLPHNDMHVFGSALTATPISAREVMQPPTGDIARIKYGGDGEITQVLCGFLGTDTSFGPLLSSLPPVLKIDVRATPLGTWIESSFRFAVSQIAAGRVGSATVIAKLSELLFVEAVSQYVSSLPAERHGWLAGLRDPQIGRALALLHANPAKSWSAESLAVDVGMSRSGFAERFASLVGQPPMQYLTFWRMHLAAQKLREGREAVAQVGNAVGYESEAAFSRAFKREFKTSPAAWRGGKAKAAP
jgi:AraC-like DNA-binding protein/mannose-6-phosphate isomerase-like protein (cupin superfamily)